MANNMLILASASPRRHELLRAIIHNFEVHICSLSEPIWRPSAVSPRVWAEALAYFKAREVSERHPDQWILGADTIVVCNERLLGKPYDQEDARRMLNLQAGRPSDVITGICLLRRSEWLYRFIQSEVTRVWMRADRTEIEVYLQSGDWRGKAGAYGIQNVGDRLIERIEGSFSNVVGLPVERVAQMLRYASILD